MVGCGELQIEVLNGHCNVFLDERRRKEIDKKGKPEKRKKESQNPGEEVWFFNGGTCLLLL